MLSKDPLFVAMTRPAMAFGVPLGGVLLNALGGLELFLLCHSLLILLLIPLIHLMQWRLCRAEPRIFELLSIMLRFNASVKRQPWACTGQTLALQAVSADAFYLVSDRDCPCR